MVLINTPDMIIDAMIDSVKIVVPLSVTVEKSTYLTPPLKHTEIGVLIGMTGTVRGRFILEGDFPTFSKLGEMMFGMPLEGEMLLSFTGELGNMIAGGLTVNIGQMGIQMDITPPTIIEGDFKLYGFDKAMQMSIQIENIGNITITIITEND